ncbi:MAG: tRNA 2-thiouridine(34) synthase MnmA [Planctomycetota bacterium]
MTATQRTLVAMSGGVDSSVAAALLAEAGESVVGVFMRNGVSSGALGEGSARSCCSLGDARDARAVADRLGIPFYVQDLARPFARLIEAFAADYAAGLTPNPCIVCNQDLKFGELLRLADDLGCADVVTGHYARREGEALLRARDPGKDQSYLLHGLLPEQLRRARFPLGSWTKAEVRAAARRLALPVADKPDSQEICFVPQGDYRAVVRERRGDAGPPGEIHDAAGAVLGRHEGIANFTVGQRRGLGLARAEPSYVTAIDAESGAITVGSRAELLQSVCEVGAVNWLDGAAAQALRSTGTLAVLVQLRHHHRAVPARLQPAEAERGVRVHFEAPTDAVTPGQYAVFYDEARVLGGGRVLRRAASAQS